MELIVAGPISVALYAPSNKMMELLENITQITDGRDNIALHLLLEKGVS